MRKLVRFLIFVLTVCLPACSAAAETEITLTFGGDCVLGTREEWVGKPDNFDACVAKNGMDWCFSGVSDSFSQDDLSLVNLECALQNGNRGHQYKKQHTFRGSTEYTQMLTGAGIEAVNLANNHTIDYGRSGEKSTRAALDAAGIEYCGYQNLFAFEKGGHKIGFGGCRETVFEQNKAVVYRDIQKLKKMGCDVIVYSCHWGVEYSAKHNRRQEKMAQYAINSGADIVVGTHPHVVQGLENRDGCAVLYSLGNLVFGGTQDMKTFDAVLARVTLHFGDDGTYKGVEVRLLPVLTSSSAPRNDFRPVPAQGADAARILSLIQADSAPDVSQAVWIPKEQQ